MRTRYFSEGDGWSHDGTGITSTENLRTIRDTLNNIGTIIVEQWQFRDATGPSRFVFDDYDEFSDDLNDTCFAGDIIDVWSMPDLCTHEKTLLSAKCPGDEGRVPKVGALKTTDAVLPRHEHGATDRVLWSLETGLRSPGLSIVLPME